MRSVIELRAPQTTDGAGLPSRLEPIDDAVSAFLKEEADDEGAFAGAVLLVARGAEIVVHAAYGHAELFDATGRRLVSPRTMRPDMLFDLASITKVLATTTALARLFEDGALELTDPLKRFLPELDRADKREITVADALTHASGLASWMPFYLYVQEPRDAVRLAAELPNTFPRGHRRVYSDVNFVLLGKVVEAIAHGPLDRVAEELVFRPLGLDTLQFRPPETSREDIVATSLGNPMEARMCATRTFPRTPPVQPEDLPGWRRHVLVGEVNDANCHLVFGGVSGHAGLFGSAMDVARCGRAMLDPLTSGPSWILQRDTLEFFTSPKTTPGQALGWWSKRIDAFPRTFGHRGFVGTQLFLDPENDVIVVLLTNRVHRTLPYTEPNVYTEPIVRSVYEVLGLAPEVRVDPWSGPGFGEPG